MGAGGTFAEIAATGPGVTTYTDPTIADSTRYCYRVRAFNAIAYSAYSNMACGASAHSLSLAVVKLGAGTGTVISTLSGIICGATCFGNYASGTAVTLTATPATGSTFTGWSGGCSGTGSCTVTLTAGTTLTATFDLSPVTLKVSRRGNHKGMVSSTPAGISCGVSCAASYPSATVVTLTATPAAGSMFAGWAGGGCNGLGSCSLTLTAETRVTATFRAAQP